jgi:hypothetical protein
MSERTWYLGPAGDLRPLDCPDTNMRLTETRYGGVFQGLSGARTVDVTGHRSEYQFNFKYLLRGDYAWLKAMHTRQIPGPVRLINPLLKNRLSTQASTLRLAPQQRNGLRFSWGNASRVRGDWPSGVLGYESIAWSDWVNAYQYFRFDEVYKTPVFPEETVTCSIYARSDVAQTVELVLDYNDRDLSQFGSSPRYAFPVTTGWTRLDMTATVPVNCAAAQFAILSTAAPAAPIMFAAPQLEPGSVATEWEQGGASPTVLVDQLTTTSPIFPYFDSSLSLLEA